MPAKKPPLRFPGAAVVVLAAVFLAGGSPASAAITQQQAGARAVSALGLGGAGERPVIVFRLGTLRPGTQLSQAGNAAPPSGHRSALGVTTRAAVPVMRVQRGRRAHAFYADLAPHQAYTHAGRFVLVDAQTGRARVSRTLHGAPLVAGRQPAFQRSAAAYNSARRQVHSAPYRAASEPVRQHPLGFRIDRSPTADLRLAKQIADSLAAQRSCSLRISDTFGEFFDFTGADRTRARLGDMFYTLSHLNGGFRDQRYSRTSMRSPVAELRRMIERSGCRNVLIYIAGQGFSKGPGTTVAVGTRVRPGRVLQQLVRARDLQRVIAANRSVNFSVAVDAPHSRGFVSLLAGERNVVLAASAAGSDGAGFGFLPSVRTGSTDTANVANPDRVLEFTNRLLAGATQFLTSGAEVSHAGGPSLLATMFARAYALGVRQDMASAAGLAEPFFAPTAAMPVPPDGPVAPPPPGPKPPAPPVTPQPPVPAPNNAPLASSSSVTTDEDTPVAITLGGIDPDGDDLTFTISTAPQYGTLSGAGAIRTYTPAPDFNGNDSLEFTVTDGRGGSASAFVTITVRAVNDAPVVGLPGAPLTVRHADGDVALAGGAVISDVDSPELTGMRVGISGLQPGSSLSVPAPAVTGTGISHTATAGQLTFTGQAGLTVYQAVLRSVVLAVGSAALTETVTLEVTVSDGSHHSTAATRSIQIVNDPPVVAFPTSAITHTEGGAPTPLPADVTVNDPDDPALEGFEITFDAPETGDVLAYTTGDGISGLWDDDSATLTLTGTATPAHYTAALRRVTYATTSRNPSAQRQIRARADDGQNRSPWAHLRVDITAVNDAPTVTTSSGPVTFTEGSEPVVVDSGVTLTDPDSAQLQGAHVQITGGLQTGDVLAATTQSGVSATYDSTTGLLTLTGPATLATYEAILRSVTFHNARLDLPAGTRTLSFTATDTAGSASAPATRSISYVDDNTAPTITFDGTGAFTEGGTGVAVASDVNIGDVDGTQLSAATITISAGRIAGDTLTAAPAAPITAAYDAGTGTLTLNGAAGHAAYQAAIESIRFSNPRNDLPDGSRTITVVVSDEHGTDSAAATGTVTVTAVNDAPAITLTSGNITYTEDDPAMAVDPALVVSDPDGPGAAITGATVTTALGTLALTGGYTPPAGLTVTGTSTKTLTVSGSSTQLAYTDVLRAVTYRGPAQIIGTGTDWVDFVVTDDASGTSTTKRRGVNLVGVNDPPVAVDDALTTGEKTAHVAGLTANDTDPDNTPDELTIDRINDVTVTVGNAVTLPSGATVTLTDAGSVSYDPDGAFDSLGIGDPDGTDSFTYRVTDPGGETSNTATVSATITPVNDAPVAAARTFRGAGNVRLRLGGSALAEPHVTASGALLTDGATDVDGPAPASVVAETVTTTGGGSATVAADGSFVYRPAPGAGAGDDTFDYRVQDAHGATGSATVTVTLVERVWFADNSRVGFTGAADSPFQSIADAVAAAPANERIFVASGSGQYSPVGTLKSGQQLVGAAAWEVNVGTVSAPEMTPIGTASARPVIGAGSGVAVTLASNTALRGINITPVASAGGAAASGATGVTLTDVAIGTGTGDGTGTSLSLAHGSATLSNVDVKNSSAGTAMLFSAATVNVGNGSTIDAAGAGLVTTGGAGHGGTMLFDELNAANGISIGTNAGVTATTGTLSARSGQTALSVTDGSAPITINGPITPQPDNRAVNIAGRTGGTITVAGPITKLGAGSGITVGSSTNATIRFTGPSLALSSSSATVVDLGIGNDSLVEFASAEFSITGTSTAAGLRASGPGTLKISGAQNTIATQTGTALSLDGLRSDGITLRSVSSSGAPNGIAATSVTKTAGAPTALTVTGDGSANRNATGGTIAASAGSDGATSGTGVRLVNTAAVSLHHLTVTGSSNHGVLAQGVDGLELRHSTISDSGDRSGGPDYEGNVRLIDMGSTTTISGNAISGGQNDNIYASQVPSATIQITGNELAVTPARAGVQNDSILVDGAGSTGAVTVAITGNDFGSEAAGDAIQVAPSAAPGAAWMTTIADNDIITPASSVDAEDMGGGITVNPSGFDGSFRYRISGNTVRGVYMGSAIGVIPGTGSGTFDGEVKDNIIGVPGQAGSGSHLGAGVTVDARGTGTHRVSVSGNGIYGYGPFGLEMNVGGTGSNPVLQATVTGNTLGNPTLVGPATAINGMYFNVGVNTLTTTNCIDVRANVVAGSGGAGDDIRMRQRFASTVRLPGYAGAGTDVNAVASFLEGANGLPANAVSAEIEGGAYAGGPAGCSPPILP